MYIIIALCSMFFGSAGLLYVYSKIMKDLKERKAQWKQEQNSIEELLELNKVIT